MTFSTNLTNQLAEPEREEKQRNDDCKSNKKKNLNKAVNPPLEDEKGGNIQMIFAKQKEDYAEKVEEEEEEQMIIDSSKAKISVIWTKASGGDIRILEGSEEERGLDEESEKKQKDGSTNDDNGNAIQRKSKEEVHCCEEEENSVQDDETQIVLLETESNNQYVTIVNCQDQASRLGKEKKKGKEEEEGGEEEGEGDSPPKLISAANDQEVVIDTTTACKVIDTSSPGALAASASTNSAAAKNNTEGGASITLATKKRAGILSDIYAGLKNKQEVLMDDGSSSMTGNMTRKGEQVEKDTGKHTNNSIEASSRGVKDWKMTRAMLMEKDTYFLSKYRRDLEADRRYLEGEVEALSAQRDIMAFGVRQKHDKIAKLLHTITQKGKPDNFDPIFNVLKEPKTKDDFCQWVKTVRSLICSPKEMPQSWRKKIWQFLSKRSLQTNNWEVSLHFLCHSTSGITEEEKETEIQIERDLERVGWAPSSPQRMCLKRILMSYSRWNKENGYSQGLNVVAGVILQVFERAERDTFVALVYMMDHILPANYFGGDMKTMLADMQAFRKIIALKLPRLDKHMAHLRRREREAGLDRAYQPPLLNVFTMRWFLTLFVNCFPIETVYRIWDSIMLDGHEMLFRVGLVVWSIVEDSILFTKSTDQFYTKIQSITQEMMVGGLLEPAELMKRAYKVAPYPWVELDRICKRCKKKVNSKKSSDSDSRRRIWQEKLDKRNIEPSSSLLSVKTSPNEKNSDRGKESAQQKKSMLKEIETLKLNYKNVKKDKGAMVIIPETKSCSSIPSMGSTMSVVSSEPQLGVDALKAKRLRGQVVTQPIDFKQCETGDGLVLWETGIMDKEEDHAPRQGKRKSKLK
eukprot:Nk52_evm76s158 gene=Nk52_evmTU76s158